MERVFASIACKGVWLFLAGLLALGTGQRLAGAPGAAAPLFQAPRRADGAHGGWLARHFGPADQGSRDRPDDRASERRLGRLACMAPGARADVLSVELSPRPSPRAERPRPITARGKTQTRSRPDPGPLRPALPV